MNDPQTWRGRGLRRATSRTALAEGLRLLDELDADAPPGNIWWEVSDSALVLSRGSRVDADTRRCADRGIDVVRRGSGGGPVRWSSDLLAMDVFVPRNSPLWDADIVASYRWLGSALADALGGEVLSAQHARRDNDRDLAALACFAGRSPGEVVVADRKLVGLSQVRRAGGLLLQVGILVRGEGAELAELLDLPADERSRLGRELQARTIGLSDLCVSDLAATRDRIDLALADAAQSALLQGGHGEPAPA